MEGTAIPNHLSPSQLRGGFAAGVLGIDLI
jgi:hypothetical protein